MFDEGTLYCLGWRPDISGCWHDHSYWNSWKSMSQTGFAIALIWSNDDGGGLHVSAEKHKPSSQSCLMLLHSSTTLQVFFGRLQQPSKENLQCSWWVHLLALDIQCNLIHWILVQVVQFHSVQFNCNCNWVTKCHICHGYRVADVGEPRERWCTKGQGLLRKEGHPTYAILFQNLVSSRLTRFLRGHHGALYKSHPALGVFSTKVSLLLKGFQQKSARFRRAFGELS